MNRFTAALATLSILAGPAAAQPATKARDTGEPAFRALYKELVETNTTFSAGDCTLAAQRMADRMEAAGFPKSDLHVFTPPGKPKDGGLVAVYPGRDPKAKAVLLLAHIDVVEAKREDWTRDPFTLVEEDGYFYGRGSFDDKAQAAIWTDLLIRYRREGYKPRRTLKVALTCGEEGGGQVNGAAWLAQNRRDLIDAGIALNEGAGGQLSPDGKPVVHTVLAGEKTFQNFVVEATNAGGHSSRPTPDNAIYDLARALDRISRYEFPLQLNDATRGFFAGMAKVVGGEEGAAMTRIVADPTDKTADAVLRKNPSYRAVMGTTCIPTLLEGGHASNALPQRARATVNCRIFPGEPAEAVREALVQAIGNPEVKVSFANPPRPPKSAPPLTPAVMKPIEAVSEEIWPKVPVIPILQAGGTDASHLNAVGIPTFGVSGIFVDPDLGRIHGLNERIRVKSLMDAREFSYRLVKLYADQKD
ncbi:M20/M25/M40 family metallo-hydrolase [Phenylobacterium sp. SCN 70-31]|uniref:M20/M25/M40 family metallo-hydrolase n=1 Tax=Phenylobacterium sp. SCN 70-31 TaxID=1660129 RepID=UPI0008694928|nr:M20/M25/M40 family metallo-hydrolase [Phenylobacterium sp. SCN 70-31]ODT84767.1 MAG: peptidase M20 [Phenylobacterium sp. SCN 70-31]